VLSVVDLGEEQTEDDQTVAEETVTRCAIPIGNLDPHITFCARVAHCLYLGVIINLFAKQLWACDRPKDCILNTTNF